MILLALDTSSAQGSLALAQVGGKKEAVEILDQISWTESSHHSDILTSQFQYILKRNSLALSEVQVIACGLGPGSFTGLRVATNFARSLGYALDIPILSLNSLHLMAFNALKNFQDQSQKDRQTTHILCVVNAFRNMVYFSTYKIQLDKSDYPLVEDLSPQACRPEELASLLPAVPYLGVGNGFAAYAASLSPGLRENIQVLDQGGESFPQAGILAQWALKYGKIGPWSDIKPLYIRASEPEEKLKIIGK